MDTVFPSLFFREPLIHYVASPCCENVFSSSSGPVIVLNAQNRLGSVTGIIYGGRGDFFLRWGVYPGAICYSVYMSTDPADPNTYVLVAECIPNPEFDTSGYPAGTLFIVTAITPEGETPFSDPVLKFPQACPSFTSTPADEVANFGDTVAFTFGVNEGLGFGSVNYLWFKDGAFFEDTTYTTENSLVLVNVDSSDEGAYTLVVTNINPTCTVTSPAVFLSICPEIIDPVPPLTVTVDAGDEANFGPFNVDEATCAGSVVYQWYKDSVFFQDTSATTQGSLDIPNAQDSDEGLYSLHITCPTLGCDEKISDSILLTVGPPVGCGATPQNVQDMTWNNGSELYVPGCQTSDMSGGAGSLYFKVQACTPWWICCPCCNDLASADKVGAICNPNASAYDVTVSLNYVSAGCSTDCPGFPFVYLSVELDGNLQGFQNGNLCTDTPNPLSVTFSLPPGPHTIRVYMVMSIHASPPCNYVDLNGSLSVSPLTHP